MSRKDPKDYVVWMKFEDDAAALKRAVTPGGQAALLLIVKDRSRLSEIGEKALECGFRQVNDRGLFRALIDESGRPETPIRKMAEIFGARAFALLKSEMTGPNYTIPLSPRVSPGKPRERRPDQPDPETVVQIGLNIRGEAVVRDNEGRYYRKVRSENGASSFVSERLDTQHTMFLRAARPGDLEAIAGSLLVMAGKGTLHVADFDQVLDAALEEGPHGRLEMPRDEAARRVGLSMVRQIGEEAIRGSGSAEALQAALRLGSATSYTLSRVLAGNAGIAPSPSLGAVLRRLQSDGTMFNIRGNDVLSAALPRSRDDGAAHQVHDLSDVPDGGMKDYAVNLLHARPDDGHTILLIPGSAGSPDIESLRNDLGRRYALECVAEITSAVATGVQDEEPVTLMAIGAKRPEPLEAVPQAAMRTFSILTSDDLRTFERETLRARARIRDYHKGLEEKDTETEDAREENRRQRPYMPLSRVTEPFTMLPIAIEGATTMALDRLRRDLEEAGGIDASVAYGLGLSMEDLGRHLTSEQVDAVAMRRHAAGRNRGFLVADQTGIGKGRTLAAIAAGEVRSSGKRVLYFTESGQINVRDVVRDLVGVGVRPVDVKAGGKSEGEMGVAFLSVGSHFNYTRVDPVSGIAGPAEISSLPPQERKRIQQSGRWPEDADIMITTYSQFNFREGDDREAFLDSIDENTLIVCDEAHNALNPRSNVGRNLRRMIARAGAANVVFGTATFARSSQGIDLYRPLLPATAPEDIFESVTKGGEVALESFTTMLAQDGVLIRRDHDLSNIEFHVSLPDAEKITEYQRIMDEFSPVVEMMIDASSTVGQHVNRAQSVAYFQALQRGIDRNAARAMSNEMNQYSVGVGAPLSNLARIAVNAIKVDQLVDQALDEIREGRKPLITFHSTNAALLTEMARDETGKISEERMEAATGLTLRDQIQRIHESIYRIRQDGDVVDARDLYPDVMEAYRNVRDRIEQMPFDLPVSPIDAVIERLEAHGVGVGEISGRTLCYRDGRIQRRMNRDRQATIDAFNSGDLDVMVYNAAGSTGGSFHAAPEYADQRPRTMLEFEPPLDPIKYVQGLGRGNRYGQVARPRVTSVVTGLTPEMRIMQQRNVKLRMLGASVDGNRAHPMLIDDVPDLLNKVGDAATRNVLVAMPGMARRLGFPEFAEEARDENQEAGNDRMDEGAGDGTAILSLANKVLSRSLSLSARDQAELVSRITVEFEAMIEELDSRNANPLRPKQLGGFIEMRDSDLFSGEEREAGNLDSSAFTAPLYLSTGIHHFSERAWTGEDLLSAVEECQRLYGTDGFQGWADRIEQNLPLMLRAYLLEGMSIEEALAAPDTAGSKFRNRHGHLTDLQWLLENMKPGVAMRFPSFEDENAEMTRVIVGLVPPSEGYLFDTAGAYRIRTVSPGDSKPTITSLWGVMRGGAGRVRFMTGLSEGPNERFMREFDQSAMLTRQLPVQILSGNIISAIQEARQHDLGSISLYRDGEGTVHRGIVVSRGKVNLEFLPVTVPKDDSILAELLRYRIERKNEFGKGQLRIYGSMDPSRKAERDVNEDFIIKVGSKRAELDFIQLRKSNYDFFAGRPGLHEALHGAPLPPRSEVRSRMARPSGHRILALDMESPEQRERLFRIGALIGEAPMVANSAARKPLNELSAIIQRLREGGTIPAREAASGEAPEAETAETAVPGGDITRPQGDDYENITFEV